MRPGKASSRLQPERAGALAQVVARAQIARPGLDAYKARRPHGAPEEHKGPVRRLDPQVLPRLPLLYLDPGRAQAGKAEAVAIKAVAVQGEDLRPPGGLGPFKADHIVLQLFPGGKGAAKTHVKAQLDGHGPVRAVHGGAGGLHRGPF